ncbi:ORF6N domain-containing protein [Fibrobacter sp.]|uniref:ORF6N domain-containing protein n=1 Tax=Fibrobacter sp. TaxID=35828 RepID=UPI00388E4F5C
MMQNGDANSDQQVHVVAVSDDGNIQALIKTIRGVQVILDRDVAGLYGVATGALNRQVKRNEERFPEDFMFKLSAEEWNNLKCQIGISSWGGDRQLPYAFTENGIAMLSSVLRSPTAIEVNIRIMRAFSAMRRFLLANAQMFQRIETVEKRQIATDAKVDSILERLDATETPLRGVFYDGQLWDARVLVLKLIGNAKKSLILIDNWATTETLDLFAKKRKGVKVTIITSEHYDKKHVPHHKISDADIATFNAQYPHLAVRYNESFHDRFLIVDDKELYLIGASLKDLGKKCFGFTKMDAGEIDRIKKAAFGGMKAII